MKIRIASNLVVGGLCAVALSLCAVSIAFAVPPPDNCFCGPVDNCDGVPISSSTYCGDQEFCQCTLLWHPTDDCIIGIKATCGINP